MKSVYEEFFSQLSGQSPIGEVILEVEQQSENGSLQFETMIPVPQEFDLGAPFMFRMYDNKGDKKAFGISGNFNQLVDSLALKLQKKPKKPKTSQ